MKPTKPSPVHVQHPIIFTDNPFKAITLCGYTSRLGNFETKEKSVTCKRCLLMIGKGNEKTNYSPSQYA